MNTSSSSTRFHHEFVVPDTLSGWRLDAAMANILPQYSRSRLTSWIKSGEITVNTAILKPKDKLIGGENISINAGLSEITVYTPENIPLDIVYEDDDLLVVNKPANLVVHPAVGNWTGTLVNALLYHCKALANLPRAGLVHRLDKDTTGLMVIAKTLTAHADLVEQLQKRTVKRGYEAVVNGTMIAGGVVNVPVGRHDKNRQKMAINLKNGKAAVTYYRVKKRFEAHTHLALQLETGRTHQIRVHMDSIQHSIVGDMLYAGRRRFPKGCTTELRHLLDNFGRQALHARSLELIHPVTKQTCSWEAPLPEDMQYLLNRLSYKDDSKT